MKTERRYQLLDAKEVSEWTGVSEATLRSMRSRPGKDPIPFTKIGGRVKYREDLLLKWMDRNTFDDAGDALAARKK